MIEEKGSKVNLGVRFHVTRTLKDLEFLACVIISATEVQVILVYSVSKNPSIRIMERNHKKAEGT